ncbi:NAD(P)H-quinone oxidoreductase [Pelagibacterium xiamenense]|uniref:NAD(P)H-quinone oxidoreductase n=1 Tax=Pelagibacterium xiamenense TaxID=2901140 RepID=UPI001E40725E|nr:NAD(P)H-quinone oxidoreductase [Pelagibacterium xiamenense]MCD7060647.1 NAD(P)H-quinone oxidoreductase [Pelagibacterium xiamenense]
MAQTMQVVEVREPGGPDVLYFGTRNVPVPNAHDVLIEVKAAGVNRPDIQQRRGLYPPPPGASDLLGLDVAGIVVEVGDAVTGIAVGDKVCALTNGGGYAQYCAVPAPQVMPIPEGFDFVQAASLPEAFFTAWNNVVWLGRLGHGEKLLIQGGTSGVGLAATQIAHQLFNARVVATASTPQKRAVCRELGAEAAFDYKLEDWDAQIGQYIGPDGFDVILDGQAGPYTQKQLDLLGFDGRLVLIASHLGPQSEVNVRALVRRRLTLTGSTLRPRDAAYKGALASELVEKVWPSLTSGAIKSVIFDVLPFSEISRAHQLLDANQQIGKVVLNLDEL